MGPLAGLLDLAYEYDDDMNPAVVHDWAKDVVAVILGTERNKGMDCVMLQHGAALKLLEEMGD